ncbi:hypothetical protein WH52_01130 [Tenacibaculum holothuriorum]|uniref:DUF3298 domain-containing protein n=1 Tax=Tenacibaculum holothuriorum TaxID=1635173 RepID=A0A1Y2PHX4_9FLAO|nr:DUF3298 domain-containing protein [Tenacibaculum holothuriorum]OSY89278.1 hypothetical protein WH52_01130 [Tenacibaculum holothuriorum]
MNFKTLLSIIILVFIFSCKKDTKPTIKVEQPMDSIVTSKETLDIDLEQNRKIQKKVFPIVHTKDDAEITKSYLQKKRFVKNTDTYELDFTYPYLDENYHHKFSSFNEYFSKKLLNIKAIENGILEAQEFLCDSLKTKQNREKRITNYKVFLQDDEHLSLLFYKENHYSGSKTAYYTFTTLNYDAVKGTFLNFEDYFDIGSEEEILKTINQKIANSAELQDCFNIVIEDFMSVKNNFIINDNDVTFYFNDCVMCPSYIGSYQISIPLSKIKPFLKMYWDQRFKE